MITLDATQLPDDLLWTNEGDWEPVSQRTGHTISGALRIRTSVKQVGRPITLVLPAQYGLADRALALSLRALADLDGQHTLTLHDGRTFTVRWRYTDGSAVEYTPIIEFADPLPTDQYTLVLRFIEV